MRIGLFTHSINPRGGVVHTLELADGLASLGHEVTVHAPAEPGQDFFRPARVATALVPAEPCGGDHGALVRQRIGEYLAYLRGRGAEFDIYHSHDGISSNALADITAAGVIPGFVRTVHHLDDFNDPYLRAAQDRSVQSAATCLCVSELWRDHLRKKYEIAATVVPNGVDLQRFRPEPSLDDHRLRDRLMAGGSGPTFLAVGGIEQRKNTLNVLRAFLLVRQEFPRAVLSIVGGVSLLDHSAFAREFEALLAAAGDEVRRSVVVTGPLPDHQMPAAYRLADVLVFPSVTEGFGLAVLEAMACGTPVVTSNAPPFTEYLSKDDALLVDPLDPVAIASAMRNAAAAEVRARLRTAGLAVASRHPWSLSAEMHESVYRRHLATLSPEHATSAVR